MAARDFASETVCDPDMAFTVEVEECLKRRFCWHVFRPSPGRAVSAHYILALCNFLYNLPLEVLHCIDKTKFPWLGEPTRGLSHSGVVGSIRRALETIRFEWQRLHFVAGLYAWLITRKAYTPWALYRISGPMACEQSTKIACELTKALRSSGRSAWDVFDTQSALCLAILAAKGESSPSMWMPTCIYIWHDVPFVAVHVPEMDRERAIHWPALASVLGDLVKCYRGLYGDLTSARSVASKTW
ncbi:hypothetical protein HPB50_008265 [Hyalomma asiaticum]|uniref:Uncharacterized protein n=1 Tax=Hyalomma asiaticum TaxID=266040 RepID=A0ACB7RN18_HYAAI|nr:hypothetical protein HPB50_008265 [Hyalomma asiaticum]